MAESGNHLTPGVFVSVVCVCDSDPDTELASIAAVLEGRFPIYELVTAVRVDTVLRTPSLPNLHVLQLDVERLTSDLDVDEVRGIPGVPTYRVETRSSKAGQALIGVPVLNEGERIRAQMVRYDLRTRYADVFGGTNGYIQDRAASLAGIARFVERTRSGEVRCASPRAQMQILADVARAAAGRIGGREQSFAGSSGRARSVSHQRLLR